MMAMSKAGKSGRRVGARATPGRTGPGRVGPGRVGPGAVNARAAGFTLVELMIVMVIIGVLASIAIPSYLGQLKHAREAVLREDLHVIRQGIDAYTMDKEKAPQSLDDLVQTGYLRAVPVDPVTHSSTTWVTSTDDSLLNTDQTEPGVTDVHSGSGETG